MNSSLVSTRLPRTDGESAVAAGANRLELIEDPAAGELDPNVAVAERRLHDFPAGAADGVERGEGHVVVVDHSDESWPDLAATRR